MSSSPLPLAAEPPSLPQHSENDTGATTQTATATSNTSNGVPQQPQQPQPPQPEPALPQTQLTLLLLSGKRKTFEFPPETTVRRVKELVWGSWPNEWRDEQLPPGPSYFRLLHLGRMLQDDSTLASNNLHPHNTPQIVHLSVKAFVPPSEASKPKKRKGGGSVVGVPAGSGGTGGANEEVGGGCCGGCVVM